MPSETPPVRLCAVAVRVPPHRLPQAEVADLIATMFAGRVRDFDRLAPVFAGSGIATRYSCVPRDWFLEPKDWPARSIAYVSGALDLLDGVARECLDRAGCPADEVGAVVCVSSTGIATPTLDARLVDRLGLARTVQRLPIFGLGCAGGSLGLARAAALARTMPGRPVLLLVVELCTLAFRHRDPGSSDIVAAALFGDGAAAVLLRAEPAAGPTVLAWGEHTWRDSLGVMGWRIAADGLGVIFARSIPDLIRRRLRPATLGFLEAAGSGLEEIDGLVCHPGGPKVLDAVAAALPEVADGLDEARAVLREHGNMSAPTVLFVLDRCLRAGRRGRHLMLSLGPGFSAGFVLLDL